MSAAPEKVAFPLDKELWHPSVLPGLVVLVSTVDGAGEPNVAPKSGVTMGAARGPIGGCGCRTDHRTAANVEATEQFVVNVPSERLADSVWALIESHGAERLRRSGLTLEPARAVAPPIVAQCRAHLECELVSDWRLGEEVFLFGRVVAATVDRELLEGEPTEQYFRLRPFFFLERRTYGSIDTAKRVARPLPAEQRLFVVELDGPAGDRAEHAAHLRALRDRGLLLMAGALGEDGSGGDLYVVAAASAAEAEAIASEHPRARAGARATVRAWTRAF